jgi:hypothetical protein
MDNNRDRIIHSLTLSANPPKSHYSIILGSMVRSKIKYLIAHKIIGQYPKNEKQKTMKNKQISSIEQESSS